jgi:hypothetical protein
VVLFVLTREESGAFAVTLGHHGATMLQVDGARMQANGDHVRRYGSRGGVHIATPLSPQFLLSGHASVWHFSGGDLSAAAEARVDGRVAQIWKATLGLERELVLENEATVDSRLAATGILAGARAETRTGALELRAAWQNLSDGNTRRRISLQVDRSLGGRLQRFRVLGRAEELAYTKAADGYFSPADFLRVDTGVEYAHPLTRSRFRGDRHGEIALGYLAGTDNRGVMYHQPTARFAVEVGGGVAIDGRAAWIRSTVYDHQTLSIGVRLGGGAGAR